MFNPNLTSDYLKKVEPIRSATGVILYTLN